MKGARQSSSLPEVGKRRREEERVAARAKKGMVQAGLREGRRDPDGGLLGPCYQPYVPS